MYMNDHSSLKNIGEVRGNISIAVNVYPKVNFGYCLFKSLIFVSRKNRLLNI